MFPDFNIYSSPLLILSLQGLIFAFLLLFRYFRNNNNSDFYLALILFITCYHQTTYTLGFMDWYDTFETTKINYFLVDLSFGLAPLIYFFVKSVTNPFKKYSLKTLIHFLPLFILVIIKTYILIQDYQQVDFSEVQNGELVVNFQWKILDPIVDLLSIFQMLIYLVLSFQSLYAYKEKINQFFSNTYKLELTWLLSFLVLYSILYVYHSFQLVVDEIIVDLSWIQGWWYYLLSGLVIIYVGVKGYFTDLSALKGGEIEDFLNKQNDLKPEVSVIENAEIIIDDKIKESKKVLESYIESNKPYLEPDLTLVSLAKKLGVSREELSETINKGFNLKFNDFINQYRIEEFKSKLKSGVHEQLSLLGVALESGFNSKATFNRAFKKFENDSPSNFLKTLI